MHDNLKQFFFPGDEWLYFKIYCGENTANKLLITFIEPLVTFLFQKQYISKWFFIRYSDPEYHIRFRVLVNDVSTIGHIINELRNRSNIYLESKEIWDIQISTYKREVQRYGNNTIEDVESFFFNDSNNILYIISENRNDNDRVLTILNYLNTIIDLFDIPITQKLLFLESMKSYYSNEFFINKQSLKTINKNFTELKNSNIKNVIFNISPLKRIVNTFNSLEKEGNLQIDKKRLLSSLIHMTVNRAFESGQRRYEFLIYQYLVKQTKTEINYKNKQSS